MINIFKPYFIFILLVSLITSCTTEVARVDLSKNENIFIKVDCKKHRQIDFYLDCDIEFEKTPTMVMDFEFYKDEEQILKGGLDPLSASSKSDELKEESNGTTKWKFYGKLEGNFIPPSDGEFKIHPTLIKNNQSGLIINKFELVLVR